MARSSKTSQPFKQLLWSRRLRWAVPLAVFVVGGSIAVGLNTEGLTHAASYPYVAFWGGSYVYKHADKNATATNYYVGYENPGNHYIEYQVNCKGHSGAEVWDGYGDHNYWWVYLPYKGGWVNEVYLRAGGNDAAAYPFWQVPSLDPNGSLAHCGWD